ncbi:MAG TPA: DUF2807 domain-containing protein [Caulobacteraceae bacterium]|jgi:hypothetical protein|nr:DUF2807 domain-containing protein [Caulobacteraceae bacterium]
MRIWPLALAGALAAGSALAQPTLDVRHAAARITVIPEARDDVSVTVLKTNPRMPLRIRREDGATIVEGPVREGLFGWTSLNCHGRMGGDHYVTGPGMERIDWNDLPQLVVRIPQRAKVRAGDAVWGVVGRGQGIELSAAGCGDWTVADQSGPLDISVSGSGDVHAGASNAAHVSISGSGDVSLTRVGAGLDAHIAGSGDISAGEVDGQFASHISGSGDVKVRGGAVDAMRAQVAGSGDVRFGGVARSLDAHIAGSGDVSVAKVTGEVSKSVAGSGEVTVGR